MPLQGPSSSISADTDGEEETYKDEQNVGEGATEQVHVADEGLATGEVVGRIAAEEEDTQVDPVAPWWIRFLSLKKIRP